MHELTVLNTLLGRYVVRFLDADAGRIEPISVADEEALADRLADAVGGIRSRAARRDKHGDPPPLTGSRVVDAT